MDVQKGVGMTTFQIALACLLILVILMDEDLVVLVVVVAICTALLAPTEVLVYLKDTPLCVEGEKP